MLGATDKSGQMRLKPPRTCQTLWSLILEVLAMAERAIFLDRDNTIIENDGYLGDPTKVKLITGAAAALASLRQLGYRLIVISNQSGVARGMFSEADVEAVNKEMCRQLREQAGAQIDASYYCPFHPEAVKPEYRVDHEWRKPKPGMIKQAADDYSLDLSQSWVIGDSPRDIAAGASVGCRTILLKDPDLKPAEFDKTDASPNFIVKNLTDAARIVAREGRNNFRDPVAAPLNMPAAAPAPVQAPAVDEAALAAKVAETVLKRMPTPTAAPVTSLHNDKLEKAMEELVVQMRHANRAQDMPEFSKARFAAVILQAVALLCLLAGAFIAASAPTAASQINQQLITLIRAGLWLLGAVVLQGAVIAILMFKRR